MVFSKKKKNRSEFVPAHKSNNLSYSYGKGSPLVLIGLIAIIFLMIWLFPIWYRFSFNSLIFGYFLFKDMRYATVFYGVIMRIIMYPAGFLNKKLKRSTEVVEEEFHKKIHKVNNEIIKRKNKIYYLNKYKWIILFSWFYLAFFALNTLTVGRTFWGQGEDTKFNHDYVGEISYFKGIKDKLVYPIKTSGYLPLVGEINLNEYSMKLNLLSAIGAGLVGLVQIFIEKKTSPRQLLMYGLMFPLGAYFLTDKWVPSGFEFALLVFEALTIIIMAVEKIYEFSKKKKKPKFKIIEEIKASTKIQPEKNS
jgi:hypothetical protein